MSGWIEEEFATADFGDLRLRKRLMVLFQRMMDSPRASIKAACRGATEVIGAYRFFNHPRTNVETILAPHRDATLLRIGEQERVLYVNDTSEAEFTTKKCLLGAGPLNDKDRRGFFVHPQLVIAPDRLIQGVWAVEIHAREMESFGRAGERKQRPFEEKESHRWFRSYLGSCSLAELVPRTQVVYCSDREGDIYETFVEREDRLASGKVAAELLIRSKENRKLSLEADEQEASGNATLGKLRERMRSNPSLGTISVEIKADEKFKKVKGGGRKKIRRSARMATLEIRGTTLELKPPYRKHRKLPIIAIQVVMATEVSPPPGEEPVEWVLLTSLPVPDFDAAVEIVELYRVRWEIEVFFRVLKTGCRIEELQLKHHERIKVAIALYMIVAWRVLYLMRLGRECPELPCDVVFEEEEWQAVVVLCHGEEGLKRKPSLGEILLQVASLGGFLGRRADGPPGAQAVWQGLTRVRDFTLAWQIYRRNHPGIHESRGGPIACAGA